jgi:hypothetical protein
MSAGGVELTVAVMTVPGREQALERLLAAIQPLEATIVVDEARSRDTWAMYRECLTVGELGSHRLVLQDDALPVEGFAGLAESYISKRAGRVVCFYVPALPAYFGRAMLVASGQGQRWCELGIRGMFLPLVATCWPAELARHCANWTGHNRGPHGHNGRADDARVNDWLKATRKFASATVPCLVDHDEEIPSALANGGRYSRRAAILPDTPAGQLTIA